MCGIVGAVAGRDVVPILIEGLKRLEYRGYDSAGVAVLNGSAEVARLRAVGKVSKLSDALAANPTSGHLGIAHTRWATHGVPNERNAHPHVSRDGVAIVHNGIIENHEELRAGLERAGYEFSSETDTEVIAHRVHHHLGETRDLFEAVQATVRELRGAYALAVMWGEDPDCIVLARAGCPLLIGLGEDENFIASDIAALLPVTRTFIILEEGDVACIRRKSIEIVDAAGTPVERKPYVSEQTSEAAEKGTYEHFMLKEIHEQPRAVAQTLQERVAGGRLLSQAFGPAAMEVFGRATSVHIVACGTSYHAGIVARYFIEQLCRVPCRVEIASEFRYRDPVVPANSLFVSISQSGETADTLAALRLARKAGFLSTLAICNVPESSLVRESELVLLTRAGPEIGVASTKAFTTQLAALGMLVVAIGKHHGFTAEREQGLVRRLLELPAMIEQALALDPVVKALARKIEPKHHALFLGRGAMFPIAMEGALKLKEISYIPTDAYAAGEMKHGPIALLDESTPVVCVATESPVLDKVLSNVEEVRARGAETIAVSTEGCERVGEVADETVEVARTDWILQPIVAILPLQLLAYDIARARGLNVDQPRNLAKTVTVE